MFRKTSRQSHGGGMQRLEISNVPIERTKTIKTDIPVLMSRMERKGGFNLGKTRTVRSVTLHVPPLPTVNKAYVCIDSDDTTSLTVRKDRHMRKDTVIDKILRRLQKRHHWQHPVILIITPSRHHKHQHKLHVIDRITRTHLGMTTLKRKELLQLNTSKAFETHCIILSNRYINLRKMAFETAIIPNIIHAANLECCCGKKCVHEECRQEDLRKNEVKKSCSPAPTQPVCTPSKKSFSPAPTQPQPVCTPSKSGSQVQSSSSVAQQPHRHYLRISTAPPSCPSFAPIPIPTSTPTPTTTTNTTSFNTIPSNSFIRKQTENLFDSWSAFRIMEPREKHSFIKLVRRINASSLTSSCYAEDLQLLFDLIKHYNVKVFIRPELCPKAVADEEEFLRCRLPRYNIECFILGATYIGGIILDSEQLEKQLLQHGDILPQVQIITDVCEITPLPRIFFLALRSLCELLCLELLYDAFGEFIFSLYNKID